MESVGVFADGEWESLSRLFSTEEIELTPHFLSQGSFPFQLNEGMSFENPTSFYHSNPEAEMGFNKVNESFFHLPSNALNSNVHYLSPESCSGNNNHGSAGTFAAILNQENYYFGNSCHVPVSNNDTPTSMDVYMNHHDHHDERSFGSFMPAFSDIMMEGSVCNKDDPGNYRLGFSDDSQPLAISIPEKKLQLKRMHDVAQLGTTAEEKTDNDTSKISPKKKPRLLKDAKKTKKINVTSKKGQKPNSDVKDEDESNTGPDRRQSTSSCSFEDDNGSQEINGGETSDPKTSPALHLNGRTRANRGSATDPQSLYARKRRERINDRLRILQNLVPNGTKVDISTMLEEAVHYAKFLQLQIKLLSSDDMWMYAPIAYNGMDIGLDLQNMSPLL